MCTVEGVAGEVGIEIRAEFMGLGVAFGIDFTGVEDGVGKGDYLHAVGF